MLAYLFKKTLCASRIADVTDIIYSDLLAKMKVILCRIAALF